MEAEHATEEDVVRLAERDGRLFELVDGVLVEKSMGFDESVLTCFLIRLIDEFVRDRRLGVVAGADGLVRLRPGLVRIPDLCFVSRERLQRIGGLGRSMLHIGPELAVEVLSPSNADDEVEDKILDYLEADVRLVWIVDPRTRTVRVIAPNASERRLALGEELDGGEVLPGFRLALERLFADPLADDPA